VCKLRKVESRYRESRLIFLYSFRTPPPNFLGALSFTGEPQAHIAFVSHFLRRSPVLVHSLATCNSGFGGPAAWVKWGLNEECENISQSRAFHEAALSRMSGTAWFFGAFPCTYSSTSNAPVISFGGGSIKIVRISLLTFSLIFATPVFFNLPLLLSRIRISQTKFATSVILKHAWQSFGDLPRRR
jgi:hypothetical protein